METVASQSRIECALVVGGRWHDMEYARLELLQKLIQHPRVRTRVYQDYDSLADLDDVDFLVSYTCDVTPGLPAVRGLRDWVAGGGKWFALHATNSVIRFMRDGRVDASEFPVEFGNLLGTIFRAHPPLGIFRVDVADPEHPLVAGINTFETKDEHYLLDIEADLHVLLDTTFEGTTPRFLHSEWRARRHPVFYIRRFGGGEILYLTLGHCRGRYDMAAITAQTRPSTRCSWELPIYHELLERGIAWVMREKL